MRGPARKAWLLHRANARRIYDAMLRKMRIVPDRGAFAAAASARARTFARRPVAEPLSRTSSFHSPVAAVALSQLQRARRADSVARRLKKMLFQRSRRGRASPPARDAAYRPPPEWLTRDAAGPNPSSFLPAARSADGKNLQAIIRTWRTHSCAAETSCSRESNQRSAFVAAISCARLAAATSATMACPAGVQCPSSRK